MSKWFERIIILILITVIATLGTRFANNWKQNDNSRKTVERINEKAIKKESKGFEIDWDTALKENPELIGWIYIPSLNISFPVVQTSDNDFYLSHASNGQYDNFGAIFMDYENNSDLSDDNTIIYGHSVEFFGGMFTDLKNLMDKDTFDKCRYFYYLTPEQNYRCNTVWFAKTDVYSNYYNIDLSRQFVYEWSDELHRQVGREIQTNKGAVLSKLRREATYLTDVVPARESHLITLSTCNIENGIYTDERYVLSGEITSYDDIITD